MFKAVKFFGGVAALASAAFAVATPVSASTLPLAASAHLRDQTPIRPYDRDQTPIRPYNRDQTPIRPYHRDQTPIRPY